MPEGDGTNGAAVAWNPIEKKYYSAFAGNESFPMAVFNENGRRISDPSLTAMFDVRGLWFNEETETIETNGYGESGWAAYKLDVNGIPEEIDLIIEEEAQSNENSCGVFMQYEYVVVFRTEEGGLEVYDRDYGDLIGSTKINLGQTTAGSGENSSSTLEQYNNTSIACVGDETIVRFGFLNHKKRQIELYNADTGLLTTVLKLPTEAVVNANFNFSYTNGIYWLFDTVSRTWTGYK